MAKDSFDVNDLYKKVFNFVALPYPALLNPNSSFRPVPKKFDKSLLGFDTEEEDNRIDFVDFPEPTSDSGVLLRLPIMFRPAFQTYASDSDGWVQLPNEPIISIRGTKKLVETEINRGKKRGVVTEEINLGAWQLGLEGLIYDPSGVYPSKEVATIRALFEVSGSLEVRNAITTAYGIKYVNITMYDAPRSEGMVSGLVRYSMGMKSDEDFDLEQIQD